MRVPMVVRWPGVIKPGTVYNDIISHEDWMPTLLAAAGVPDIVEKLKKGPPGQRQDLQGAPDGYNFLPLSRVKPKRGPANRSCTSARAVT
jgi:arylsulfatase A-like enzyme